MRLSRTCLLHCMTHSCIWSMWTHVCSSAAWLGQVQCKDQAAVLRYLLYCATLFSTSVSVRCAAAAPGVPRWQQAPGCLRSGGAARQGCCPRPASDRPSGCAQKPGRLASQGRGPPQGPPPPGRGSPGRGAAPVLSTQPQVHRPLAGPLWCPVTNCTPVAMPRWVRGMPSSALIPVAALMPATKPQCHTGFLLQSSRAV